MMAKAAKAMVKANGLATPAKLDLEYKRNAPEPGDGPLTWG